MAAKRHALVALLALRTSNSGWLIRIRVGCPKDERSSETIKRVSDDLYFAFLSSKEQAVCGVLGFVLIAVTEAFEEVFKCFIVGGRDVDADENAAVVGAVVAVVEEGNVPAALHMVEEAGECAGAFGELEAD